MGRLEQANFGILTTDTVRISENFLKKGFLCHCSSYTSFKKSAMRAEVSKTNRANRTEILSSLKKKYVKERSFKYVVILCLDQTGRVVINTGENKFTDFRKANEPFKCNFI